MNASLRVALTLLALTTLGGSLGCEIISSVDRSKIPGGDTGNAGTGGGVTSGTGGAGGATTTTTPTTTTGTGGSGGTTTTGTGGSGGSGGQGGSGGTTTTGTGGSGGTTTTGTGGSGGTGGGGTGGAGGQGPCGSPTECPGVDAECAWRTCEAGVCGVANAPAGKELAKQSAGDCKKKVCDGNGAVTDDVDDADLPVDGKQCTDDVCTAGVPSNPLLAAGTACTIGGALCDGAGNCAECLSPADCAGPNTECQHPTCDAGKCGTKIMPVGAPVASQTQGDCQKNECDGFGDVHTVADDTDGWDDGNECTTESCSAGKKVTKNKASGATCGQNGGLVCDGAGACKGCVDASNCAAPQNPCMVAACVNNTCGSANKQDGAACDDGNACSKTDTCQAGACTGSNPVVCSASDQCHDTGTCDSKTGACSNPPKNDGASCSDGNGCTKNDTCQAGACTPGTGVTCSASDQCHVAGVCDPQSGVCSNPPKNDGAACNDGNACTKSDTCQAGACTGASPVVCSALDQCHVAGTCDTQTGVCSDPPKNDGVACNDGDACTKTDTCQAGACKGANPVVCAPLGQCYLAGTCDQGSGQCTNPKKPDGTGCDDGDPATQNDKCLAGVCGGQDLCVNVVCTAKDSCHDVGTCDPGTGLCSDPPKTDGAGCNDGNACTQTDTCQAGVCTGSNAVTCAAPDQCHLAGVCDPLSGACTYANKNDGDSCDDADKCTQTDTCQAGKCTGGNAVVCGASDQCHDVGTCDPGTGACSDPPKNDGVGCSDGDKCTQTDTCQAGKCTGGNAVVCAPLDQCHDAGTCDPGTGACSNPTKLDGVGCDDNDLCTQTDTCQAGKCTGANPVVCISLEQCKNPGTCDPSTGVCSAPQPVADGNFCDDSDKCTQADFCENGACKGTSPVTCAALDSCHTAGTCNAQTGLCTNPVKAEGASCTFGNNVAGFCNDAATCSTTDLVVLRVNSIGGVALTNASTAAFLDKFTSDGTPLNPASLALPIATSGNNLPVTLSGTATSEGGISRSSNGAYVVVPGYGVAPGTSSVNTSSAAAVNRVVARVDASWNIDSTTRSATAFSGGNIRGAATSDGTAIWASGSTTGVQLFQFGEATSKQITTSPTNIRVLQIFGGQLYGTSGSTPFVNVFAIGSGLPADTATATSLVGMPTASGPSPYSFALFDRNPNVAGRDTLYVADDRNPANGGLQKWTYDGTTWTLQATWSGGLTVGLRGLVGYVAGNSVVLFATTADTSLNRLVRLIDDGVTTPTATVLATATTNTMFRGVALAPQ
jgi:hypothetical protein